MQTPTGTTANGENTPPENQEQRTDNAAVSQAAGPIAAKVRKPKRSPEEILYTQQKAKREAAEKSEVAALAGWKEAQRRVKLIAGSKVIGGILERAEKASRESVISSVQILATEQENQVLEEYLQALATAPPPASNTQKK